MQGIKLIDKRVDKICEKNGLIGHEIFYSPLSNWFLLVLLILLFSGTGLFLFYYLFLFNKLLILIPISYVLISFLMYSKLSNSFAITENEIVVINPNFPFRKYIVYNKDEVIKITIDSSKKLLFSFFLLSNQNYLQIKSINNIETYYCEGLEILGYEDIWTEKSLDCLHKALLRNTFKVEFNFL